jgi:2-methylisocitrate lyase-like PEP mutase family enzyme
MDSVAAFRALHENERVLVLANAWDAATAALFRAAGAPAIATTSAGVAWTRGFPDGDVLPREELFSSLREICRASGGLPVTADIEGGYSNDPEEVASLVADVRALGVSGINLEDGTGSPEVLSAKIEAIKRRLKARGDDIFINSRTDIYLLELASGETAIREVIARAQRYAQAGADAFFVPALDDVAAIRTIARAITIPLNILAVPGLPTLHELRALGVRRVSAGSALAKIAYGAARRSAAAFVRGDSTEMLFDDSSVGYGEVNALFQAPATNA